MVCRHILAFCLLLQAVSRSLTRQITTIGATFTAGTQLAQIRYGEIDVMLRPVLCDHARLLVYILHELIAVHEESALVDDAMMNH